MAELFRAGSDPFDGVVRYARTKRALVVLNEMLAERLGEEREAHWAALVAVAGVDPAATPVREAARGRSRRTRGS